MDLQEDLLTALLHSLLSEHCPPDVDDGGGVGDCADPDVEVAALHQPVLHAGHHVAGVALTVSAAVYTDSIMYSYREVLMGEGNGVASVTMLTFTKRPGPHADFYKEARPPC